ncbi:hypothetical protein GcM3_138020, partial [Golovinomyces cichoracearum]
MPPTNLLADIDQKNILQGARRNTFQRSRSLSPSKNIEKPVPSIAYPSIPTPFSLPPRHNLPPPTRNATKTASHITPPPQSHSEQPPSSEKSSLQSSSSAYHDSEERKP